MALQLIKKTHSEVENKHDWKETHRGWLCTSNTELELIVSNDPERSPKNVALYLGTYIGTSRQASIHFDKLGTDHARPWFTSK